MSRFTMPIQSSKFRLLEAEIMARSTAARMSSWVIVLTVGLASVVIGAAQAQRPDVVVQAEPMIHVLQPQGGQAGPVNLNLSTAGDLATISGATLPSAGLIINAVLDASITSDPNSAAIISAIQTAITNVQTSFSDPITVTINFQEMTSGLGQSSTYFGSTTYASFLAALKADAKTANDTTAVGLLANVAANPVNGSTSINVKTANFRAVGITANPPSGQPDGFIGLNTTITSPGSVGSTLAYSLIATAEHEIDEVLGLGSSLPNIYNSTIFPEDLYRYSSANVRSFTTTDSRTSLVYAYFAIDGVTALAEFDNQNDGGDFGDWQSAPRRNGVVAKVQDAFATPLPVTPTYSVELTALDVIGYDRYTAPTAVPKDLVVNFNATYGTWMLSPAGSWSTLHPRSPLAMVKGDLDGNGQDDLVFNFGPGVGVWAWMNHSTWQFLHGLSPSQIVTGDLDNNGHDEVIAVFPGYGIWRWSDGTWINVHGLDAMHLAVGQLDGLAGKDLIADFPTYGLWVLANNTTWSQLHPLNAASIVTADLDGNGKDDVVINFTGAGIWIHSDAGTWRQLHGLNAVHMAAGHLDTNALADLVIDFGGGTGIWTFRNNATWSFLHPLPSTDLLMVDRDGNGIDEVEVNFGPTNGLWQYANDSSWSQIHPISPAGLAAGKFH
jgi:hypothetical protein